MYSSSYRAAWYSALVPAIHSDYGIDCGRRDYLSSVVCKFRNDLGLGLTIGGLNAFIGYITFMLWPVQDMARVYAQMQHAIASAERTFSLLDTRAEIVDKPDAIDPGYNCRRHHL